MTIPSAPQIGTTGVIQQPGIAEQLAPLLQSLEHAQRLKAQQQQEARLAKGQSLNAFIALSRIEPNLLDTETGKGMARDAGINPEQLVAQRHQELVRHQEAVESVTKNVPEETRGALATYFRLAQIAPDLPADIKTDIYNRALPPGSDHKAFDRWLALWGTGGPTAEQAATASGFAVPEGFPKTMRAPRGLTAASDADILRSRKLTTELNSLNTLIDDATRDLDKEHERINLRFGGAYYKQTGQFPPVAPGQQWPQNRATVEFERFQRSRYPQFSSWQERRTQLQQELDNVVASPRQPVPTTGPAPRRPRSPTTPTDPKAEQRAAWDAAAEVLRQQRKDPVSTLGPRP